MIKLFHVRSLSAGLNDAITHAKGESTKTIEHKMEAVDVKAIRKKTGMSQQQLCPTFGISLEKPD